MRKEIALGVQDFRKLREENYYYVDKTYMIEEFLQRGAEVTLVTRPRRFGKSLNMSMMAEFFDIKKESRDIFEGTAVMGTVYGRELNRHPVLMLSFSSVKGSSRRIMLAHLFESLAKAYEPYMDLIKSEHVSDILKEDIQNIFSILKGKSPEEDAELKIMYAIQKLSKMLEEHYRKKVYIFIDEYDTPFIEAHVNGYYPEIHDLLSALLSTALKGNESLERALLTGIQRVAKENIFSGLNNLLVCTVKDPEFSDSFGFTSEETRGFLHYYGLELNEAVKDMYDGYYFGGTEIYNPWSISNFAQRQVMEPYWVNTSENKMIKQVLSGADRLFQNQYEELLEERELFVSTDLETSFFEDESSSTLWGLFINTGYLTIIEKAAVNRYRLKIPNGEVREEFKNLTAHYLRINGTLLNELFQYLKEGNSGGFLRIYQQILQILPSYYDLKSENSYHMMMLGMCAYLWKDYEVISNREQGKGRSDILLKSGNRGVPSIILEFKYTKNRSDNLSALAEAAVDQMIEKQYAAGLTGDILYVGIAHCQKTAQVTIRRKENGI